MGDRLTTHTLTFTSRQLSLISNAMSYRAGPHPFDDPRVSGEVFDVFEIILGALMDKPVETCPASSSTCDAPMVRCSP